MKLVIDANVAIKWYVVEPHAQTARQLLGGDHELFAPEHLLAEVGQALWRHFREGSIDRAQIRDAMSLLPRTVELIPLDQVASTAVEMSCEIAYTVYDCLYVATAVQQNCPLITDDIRLISALSRSQWAGVAQAMQTMQL